MLNRLILINCILLAGFSILQKEVKPISFNKIANSN